MSDPFLITGPAVISFSGGRTSGYMLWRILQAHGGTLPDNVIVCFDNTGRELEPTLAFVKRCSDEWKVLVHWLEYQIGSNSGIPVTAEVTFETASRNGEPFEAMLSVKSVLPNKVNSMCTIELKTRTTERFLRETYGWEHWGSVVGMRTDEHDPDRAKKAIARGLTSKDRWHNLCPLYEAGIDEEQVFAFWRSQPFDLELAGPWEGNCGGCFKKRLGRLELMFLHHPEHMEWWIRQEAKDRGNGLGSQFRSDYRYADLAKAVRDQGRLELDPKEVFEPCDVGCAS